MAAKGRKITREELQHDEVAEGVMEFLNTVKTNRLKILAAAVAVILLVSIGTAYSAYRTRIKSEASKILNEANITFDQLPSLQDQGERKKKLDQTVNSLQTLIDRYKDSSAARSALFLQGNCYAYMDEHAKAQKAFERYTQEAKSNEERAQGELAQGYSLENEFYLTNQMNKLDEATKLYVSAEQAAPPKSALYYYALYSQARILDLTKHDADALTLYKKILQERPAPMTAASPDSKKKVNPGGIESYVLQQIEERMKPISFYATAQLRAERLEATLTAAKPEPVSPTEANASPTTPTAATASLPAGPPMPAPSATAPKIEPTTKPAAAPASSSPAAAPSIKVQPKMKISTEPKKAAPKK